MKLIIEIAHDTGVRVGQIRNTKWEYVHDQKPQITYPPHAIKTGKRTEKEHTVILSDELYNKILLLKKSVKKNKYGVIHD